MADSERVRQILVNLLSNAIKFTPENGDITIGMKKQNSNMEVYVKDTGSGIPEDKKEKIFSKFEQIKKKKDEIKGAKGTGLGLAIAKGLAELHGGRLRVDSELGEGSTFYFTLKVAAEKEDIKKG